MEYRRLPLEGLVNARELGGFAAEGGRTTQYRRFVRSEVPCALSPGDMEFLKNYGVALSVDFRGRHETERMKSMLSEAEGIVYKNIPTYNKQVAQGAGVKNDRPFENWWSLYIKMCDGGRDWVKAVFEAFAGTDGCIIYNCTTGKDRTGIISALLLGLCGVAEEDIIADYAVSEVYMRKKYLTLFKSMPPLKDGYAKNAHKDVDSPFYRTEPENMRILLGHFKEKYGGITEYLEYCGLQGDVIKRIKHRLLEK